MTEHTCDASVPADLAAGLSGDAAEPCFLEPGHDQWSDHNNAYVTWPAQRRQARPAVSRADLILSLMDRLSADDAELLRTLLHLAELARPDATDVELLEDALVSLDGLFASVDEETGR